MAKKKTNYISYELRKLEKYCKQVQAYLDKKSPEEMTHDLDIRYSQAGNPIVKTIASRESQIKCWMDRLKELPALLAEINILRKAVNEEVKEKELRGNQQIPGFMQLEEGELKKGSTEEGYVDDHYVEEKFDDDVQSEKENLPVIVEKLNLDLSGMDNTLVQEGDSDVWYLPEEEDDE